MHPDCAACHACIPVWSLCWFALTDCLRIRECDSCYPSWHLATTFPVKWWITCFDCMVRSPLILSSSFVSGDCYLHQFALPWVLSRQKICWSSHIVDRSPPKMPCCVSHSLNSLHRLLEWPNRHPLGASIFQKPKLLVASYLSVLLQKTITVDSHRPNVYSATEFYMGTTTQWTRSTRQP